MPQIFIGEQKETGSGWEMTVRVGDLDFMVTLDREYWQKLTGGKADTADLVRRSFEFLLTREPKESILRRFNLRDIERYFPDYPNKIRKP